MTTAPTSASSANPKASRPARQRLAKPAARSALGQGVGAETGRRAAAILEVLAGERTPQQAAAALAVSVNYFYLLERQALAGLLRACQPQPKGPPPPSAERKLAALEQELARCRRECQRQAALVRATQRAVGLPALPAADSQKAADKPGRRRRRRPTVRALRAAEMVRNNSATTPPAPAEAPLSAEREASPSATHEQETEHGPARG